MDTSYFTLACNLITPVSLGSIFDYGTEVDSYIGILFAPNKIIEKPEALSLIGKRYTNYIEGLLENDYYPGALDLFDLTYLKSDTNYIVLLLKESTELYAKLRNLNAELRQKCEVKGNLKYTPYLTLARLKEKDDPNKYLKDERLKLILQGSVFQPEDFQITLGSTDEDHRETGKTFDLTQNRSVSRFFRCRDLRQELEELSK